MTRPSSDTCCHATIADALEQQLLDAVNNMFLSFLCHQQLQYSQVLVLQLLQHLIDTTHNIVTAKTLEDNRNCQGADWNPNDGIMEVLYTLHSHH